MLFAIWLKDVENSIERRLPVRAAHLERIKLAVEAGVIKMAGPFPNLPGKDPAEVGFAGGLMVADFPSAQAAEQWLRDDPYAKAGVFEHFEIQPFNMTFVKP